MKTGYTKQDLIDSLATTLRMTSTGVVDLELKHRWEPEDTVVIHYQGGGTQMVNIHMDSGIAIIRDVCQAID